MTEQYKGKETKLLVLFVFNMKADFDSSNKSLAIQEEFERSEASISFEKSQDDVLNLLVANLVKE